MSVVGEKTLNLESVEAELKKVGLKATAPRIKVLMLFKQMEKRHISAEEAYKCLLEAGEEISLATVYRVLTQFESAGLLSRHNFEEGRAVFEIDEGTHHDHMVCIRCDKVVEFVDEEIERRQERIAKENQFQMMDHTLVLYGLCSDCSET